MTYILCHHVYNILKPTYFDITHTPDISHLSRCQDDFYIAKKGCCLSLPGSLVKIKGPHTLWQSNMAIGNPL